MHCITICVFKPSDIICGFRNALFGVKCEIASCYRGEDVFAGTVNIDYCYSNVGGAVEVYTNVFDEHGRFIGTCSVVNGHVSQFNDLFTARADSDA